MKKMTSLLIVLAVAALAATYASSCHCGPPPLSGERAAGGVAATPHPITIDNTTDADFLLSNRGYGVVEDTSISSGAIRRSLGLPNFGLDNVNAGVDGWKTLTNVMPIFLSSFGGLTAQGRIYVLGGCLNGTCSSFARAPYYQSIQADGSIGPGSWINASAASFPVDLYAYSAVEYNGYFYVTGGTSGGVAGLKTVLMSKINADGSLGAWTAATPLTNARYYHAAAVYNGYLYVIGGMDGGVDTNIIEYARINADGTLGAWKSKTDPALPASHGHAAASYAGSLYVTGGSVGVKYAKLNADGAPQAFVQGTLPNQTPTFHTMVAYNNRLYMIGGIDNVVRYIAINTDGSLGAAWTQTTSLPATRTQHASVVVGGFLYVLGGGDGSGALQASVLLAPIRPDGSVGTTWIPELQLPSARKDAAAVIDNSYIYLVGGEDASGQLKDILYAPLLADGTVGPWQTVAQLGTKRSRLTAAIYDGWIYAIGGYDGTGRLNTIEYAQIKPDGTIDGATWNTATFTTAREYHSSVVMNGRLYILGGTSDGINPLGDVQQASFNGTIGGFAAAFQQTTGGLPSARWGHASVVSGGNLIVVGGCIGTPCDASKVLNHVHYAKPDPGSGDISAGGWTPASTTYQRAFHRVDRVGKTLYLTGGLNGTSARQDVLYAPLDNQDVPGLWGYTTQLPALVQNHATAAYNGYLHVLGGYSGSGSLATAFSAPVNANGAIFDGANQAPLPAARNAHETVVTDGWIYVASGLSGGIVQNTFWHAPIDESGMVGTWSDSSSGFPVPNRSKHKIAVMDGYMYLAGGADATGTAIANVDAAPIGADPAFQTTAAMTKGRKSHALAAYHGHLYAISGFGTSSYLSDYEYASAANGQLGTWTSTSLTGTIISLQGHCAVAHAGRIYVLGGDNGGTRRNKVYVAPIKADASLGDFAETTPMNTARSQFVCTFNNGYLYVAGGLDSQSSPIGTMEFAPINPDGTVGVWTLGSALPYANGDWSGGVYNGMIYMTGGVANGGRDVLSAHLVSQQASTKTGFSKVYDLAADGTINSVDIDGRLAGPGSVVSVSYRYAKSVDAVFSGWAPPTWLYALPGQIQISATARWLEVGLTIEDNGRLGVPSGAGSSEITGIHVATAPLGAGGVCVVDADCTTFTCVLGFCCPDRCNTPGECYASGTGDCSSGTCKYPSKPAGTSCYDTDTSDCYAAECDGNGTCDQKHKALTGTPCTPDTLSCTDDVCSSDGSGKCTHPVTSGNCLIRGTCFKDGDINGGNGCEVCSFSTSPVQWSFKAGPCNDGDNCTKNDACADGVTGICSDGTHCWIDSDCPTGQGPCGNAVQRKCVGTAYTCTRKECEDSSVCDGTGQCTVVWSAPPTPCTDDTISCTLDFCDGTGRCTHPIAQGYCLIDGKCYSGGATSPDNDCQFCDTMKAQDKWTDQNQGNPCDDKDPCTKDTRCDNAGNCTGGTPLCGCATDADCAPQPNKHCGPNGNCVECTLNAHCPAGEICNMATFRCQVQPADGGTDAGGDSGTDAGHDGGADSGHDGGADAGLNCRLDPTVCSRDFPSTPVCDMRNGQCVECRLDNDCPSLDPERPWCETTTSTCIQCRDDSDCDRRTQTCDSHHRCVALTPDAGVDAGGDTGTTDAGKDGGAPDAGGGCKSDNDCANDTLPVCDTASGTCVGCLVNGDCTRSGRAICDTEAKQCVGCLENTDCSEGYVCNADNTCVKPTPEDAGQQGGGADAAAAEREAKNPYGCACAVLTL